MKLCIYKICFQNNFLITLDQTVLKKTVFIENKTRKLGFRIWCEAWLRTRYCDAAGIVWASIFRILIEKKCDRKPCRIQKYSYSRSEPIAILFQHFRVFREWILLGERWGFSAMQYNPKDLHRYHYRNRLKNTTFDQFDIDFEGDRLILFRHCCSYSS